jgi:hypothetical protein
MLGLKILKFFVADPDQGSGAFVIPRIRDGKIRIRAKHPGSSTLVVSEFNSSSPLIFFV